MRTIQSKSAISILGRNLCLRPLEFAPRFSTRLHTYFIINKTNFFCHFSPRLGKPYCLLLCLQTTSSRNWKWQLTIENKRLLPVLSIFRYQKLKANERNYSYELCNLWKATVLFIYFYLFIYFAKKGLQILLNNWMLPGHYSCNYKVTKIFYINYMILRCIIYRFSVTLARYFWIVLQHACISTCFCITFYCRV